MATRTVGIKWTQKKQTLDAKDIAIGAIASIATGSLTFSSRERCEVPVPHCEEHSDGARVQVGRSPAPGISIKLDELFLIVRSYRFYREYCDVNDSKGATL
ncbi:MAG: hypothetical protein JKY65_04450 [Planctomycetes bacterium]|nr:hypothetical protein [Planctomycetota bacterium]